MKLGIISDIHGSLEYLQKALTVLNDVDRYIFLGDYLYHGPRNPIPKGYDPLETAKLIKTLPRKTLITGNCDAPIDLSLLEIPEPVHYQEESYGIVKFFLTHGWDPNIEESIILAKKHNAHILIHGHTHIPIIQKQRDLIIINPGSISLPKNDTPHSVIKLNLKDTDLLIEFIDIETNHIYLYEKIEITEVLKNV